MAAPTQAIATATPTRAAPTPLPTRTPTATPTRPPSATPAPTPTATATGGLREYVVQSGDSLALIGEKLDLSWQTIAALNGLTAYSMLQPGDKLRLPTLTPAPAPTATPTRATVTAAPGTARPTAIVTPTIAPETPTPTPTVAAATPTPAAADTPAAAAPTATPRPLPTFTYTPLPSPTASPAPALAALILINPGDGSSYDGNSAQIELIWQNKDYLPTGAVYRVTIQWINKGAPMTDYQNTTATSIRAPLWLWGEADQPGRQYTWSVQIVQLTTDGKGGERIIPLSLPSEQRKLYWK